MMRTPRRRFDSATYCEEFEGMSNILIHLRTGAGYGGEFVGPRRGVLVVSYDIIVKGEQSGKEG